MRSRGLRSPSQNSVVTVRGEHVQGYDDAPRASVTIGRVVLDFRGVEGAVAKSVADAYV